MAEEESMLNLLVVWRGKQFNVKMDINSTIKEFGHRLQTLTNVKPDTMRLLIPKSANKGSKILTPFSDGDSNLSLQEAGVEGKPIRMMGVFDEEIENISRHSAKDLRILGFEEEEKRLKHRLLGRRHSSLKLPMGTYIFCDFRTLQIPGLELNPPTSEALKLMHTLASDPGIVAIMNKHHWRVGIMTEMAPEGYVGISPKCLLGFNKNQGEEISLRLRTDDLKGFRKYASIKKTLLHELAHMVHSQHDANFHALDKQLNEEAFSLNWTKSRGRSLSSYKHTHNFEEEFDFDAGKGNGVQKLGGKPLNSSTDARSASVAAAYRRLVDPSASDTGTTLYASPNGKVGLDEPDPDDCESSNVTSGNENSLESNLDGPLGMKGSVVQASVEIHAKSFVSSQNEEHLETDQDDLEDEDMFVPDPDDFHGEAVKSMPCLPNGKKCSLKPYEEPDPDDSSLSNAVEPDPDDSMLSNTFEPDPDDSMLSNSIEPYSDDSQGVEIAKGGILEEKIGKGEPDPDDCKETEAFPKYANYDKPICASLPEPILGNTYSDDYGVDEPDPDDSKMENDSPNSDSGDKLQNVFDSESEELQRIGGSTAVICAHLQKAIELLRSEATPVEANGVLQTLFKIIRNVIEHPDKAKFRRLRKANPLFQKNIANYKAAMEVLNIVGFHEDLVPDEIGRVESYMVMKRNDPGLLWLAKSSLEMCIA